MDQPAATPTSPAVEPHTSGIPLASTLDSRVDRYNWDFKPEYLIVRTKDFIVGIDGELYVDWQTSDEYDARGAKNESAHNAIMGEAAILEVMPCHGFSNPTKLHFKRLIGEAIWNSLEHDYKNAKVLLEAARIYVQARSEEISRFWYLSAAFLTSAPLAAIGIVAWIARGPFVNWFGEPALWIFLGTIAGALGALLSVIWRSGKLAFDCSAGAKLHYLEGACRISAGALSGLLVALAVWSQLIFASLAQGQHGHGILLVACLAAGSGERLATSIISRFEGLHSKPDLSEDKKASKED